MASLISFLALIFFLQCQTSPRLPEPTIVSETQRLPLLKDRPVRNIIFYIGDGMGITQITSARIYAVGPDGRLTIDRFPITGLVTTHSADRLVTDSAAGATAMSTGVKTRNGMVGMSADSTAYFTILEIAQELDKATGLVATSSITHATPASFAAHVPSRRMEPLIAEQLLQRKVNVLLGGGRAFFIPRDQDGSAREDNQNLLDLARNLGYTVVETRQALQDADGPYLLGLFADKGMLTRESEPTLAEMTEKALEILRNDPEGFFLMVEGSQIDWGGHANDAGKTIRQLLQFDEAVKVGVDFALKDFHTLVIVTADHETGGMALEGGSVQDKQLDIDWTTNYHTGQSVPLFAFGPHALSFSGVLNNTDIPRLIAVLWGVSDFPRPLQQSTEPLP
ncbi:MAG: alkaline phosphatase [Calditrichaeota bacterium]|nr:alkaline phosphatase [Calditrichota bacterium]